MINKKLFYILATIGIIAFLGIMGVRFFSGGEQRVYRIGALIDTNTQLPALDGFKDGMAELGYKEGRNVSYIVKVPQADVELREQYAQDLMASNLDLIITGTTSATTPFRNAEKEGKLNTPVVFLDAGNPSELVDNLFEPQGRITGVGGGHVDLVGNRIELLKEIDPSIKKIAVMAESTHGNYANFMRLARQVAEVFVVKIVEIPIVDEEDAKAKVNTIDHSVADAFLFFTSATNTKNTKLIADHFKKVKMLTMGHNLERGVEEGVLFIYGASRYSTGKQASLMADKIFKGIPIKEISVELPREQFFEINLTVAKEIGFSIPKFILDRATRLYEE